MPSNRFPFDCFYIFVLHLKPLRRRDVLLFCFLFMNDRPYCEFVVYRECSIELLDAVIDSGSGITEIFLADLKFYGLHSWFFKVI